MIIAGLVADCTGQRYGDWRHVATGCNALVLIHNVIQPCARYCSKYSEDTCLQCFDTVGWASGRAVHSDCKNWLTRCWLSVWSEVQMSCIWSSWCHCHVVISCLLKSRMV